MNDRNVTTTPDRDPPHEKRYFRDQWMFGSVDKAVAERRAKMLDDLAELSPEFAKAVRRLSPAKLERAASAMTGFVAASRARYKPVKLKQLRGGQLPLDEK